MCQLLSATPGPVAHVKRGWCYNSVSREWGIYTLRRRIRRLVLGEGLKRGVRQEAPSFLPLAQVPDLEPVRIFCEARTAKWCHYSESRGANPELRCSQPFGGRRTTKVRPVV